jgi:hypothetical protein
MFLAHLKEEKKNPINFVSFCVYVFQGLTVGWWKEERHSSDQHREVGRVQVPAGWATHGCGVVCVLCRLERRKERRGWAWVAG